MDCCGAQEYKDWTNTTYGGAKGDVPDSCCISDIEGCGVGILKMKVPDQVRIKTTQSWYS